MNIIKSNVCNKHHFLLSIVLSGVVLAFKELILIKSVGTCALYLVFVNVNMDRFAKTCMAEKGIIHGRDGR